jgi:molecular chaperone HscB
MNVTPEKSDPLKDLSFFKKEMSSRPCWSCESEVKDPHNCSNCSALQQFLKNSDYFTLFGLGYFLAINLDALEEEYYALSRKFHPDYYQATSREEQAISLENTAHLTTAYRTLKDPKKRMSYLIQLAGQGKKVPPAAPAELFEAILETQEHLEAFSDKNGSEQDKWCAALENDLQEMEASYESVQMKLMTLSSKWDTLETLRNDYEYSDEQQNCLKEMKRILSHEHYLDRIIGEIEEALD